MPAGFTAVTAVSYWRLSRNAASRRAAAGFVYPARGARVARCDDE